MDNRLERAAGGVLASDIGEVTPVSWAAPTDMTFDQWARVGNTLQTIQGSINWWIGDWLNEGERRWGEMYAQAVEVTGWDYNKLSQAKWVAGSVEFCTRVQNLSWTHHRYVANLPSDKQRAFLDAAENFKWNTRQLREAIKEAERLDAPPPPSPNGNGHELLPSDYEEPADYYAALYGETDDEEPASQGIDQLLHQSNSNEWYTPPCYIEGARAVMGDIDTDPASNHMAQSHIQAATYFTKEDDGLSQRWYGRVWLNPPYGGMSGPFVEKLFQEIGAGHVTEAIVLVNANSTETNWFSPLWDHALCFTDHRINFHTPEGPVKNQSTHGSVFVYIGPNTTAFYKHFNQWGYLVRRVSYDN